ncbi:MAG: hypothetical protein U0P81_13020 [Holophagaceae bacterium]
MEAHRVEVWRDESGDERELVLLGFDGLGGASVVRARNTLDAVDGDVREGYSVLARFGDPEDARAWLLEEGFEPLQ